MKQRKIAIITILCFSLCNLSSAFAEEVMEKQALEYFKQGVEAQKSGDIDYAISLYSKAMQARPNYTKAINNLGTAYAQQGNRSKAEELYNQAIVVDP